MSIARTRRETIASSFFNPDAGRNSPRGSTDLPQRNVLPPRCLTLRLFFFLEPLYPFQRCSIRSLSSPSASFCRFYPSFFPSLSQVVHSFLGLSPLVHTTPFLSPCYPQVGLLAFIVGGSRFSSFYFSISRRMRFSSSFPL